MANLYDINKKYTPGANGGSLTNFNLSNESSGDIPIGRDTNTKPGEYTIDLTQSNKGTPGTIYSVNTNQQNTSKLFKTYTVETNQSNSGFMSTSYSVDVSQQSTAILMLPMPTPDTNQSTSGNFITPMSTPDINQSTGGNLMTPMSTPDTSQSNGVNPNTIYNVSEQIGQGNSMTPMSTPDTGQSEPGNLMTPMSTPDTGQSEPGNLMTTMSTPDTSQTSGEPGPILGLSGNTLNQYYRQPGNTYEEANIEKDKSSGFSKDEIDRQFFHRKSSNAINKKAAKNNRILAGASALLGIPSIASFQDDRGTYETLSFTELRPFDLPFTAARGNTNFISTAYQDYRARLKSRVLVHGAAAGARGSTTGAAYALASSTTKAGAYLVFNLEQTYGFPRTQTEPGLDFSARSEVATRWKNVSFDIKKVFKKGEESFSKVTGEWAPTNNPLEMVKPFTGDKVTVIDFGKRKKSGIYRWKPENFVSKTLNKVPILGSNLGDKLGVGLTQDLIKFYLTGPKMHAGAESVEDDVIVFRAILTSLTDSFNPAWNSVKYIGRADPNYTYQGFSRTIDVNFTVYAQHRDELKPIWRKLNALSGYTAPEYSNDTIAMKSPYLRITIGDIFVHQPIAITSLFYTFVDTDTTWETNIEKDPTMMQLPKKIDVNMQGFMITDFVPQKGGKFYSLAKSYNEEGTPVEGNDNWLSDTISDDVEGEDFVDRLKARQERRSIKKADRAFKKELKEMEKSEKAITAAIGGDLGIY